MRQVFKTTSKGLGTKCFQNGATASQEDRLSALTKMVNDTLAVHTAAEIMLGRVG